MNSNDETDVLYFYTENLEELSHWSLLLMAMGVQFVTSTEKDFYGLAVILPKIDISLSENRQNVN